MIYKLTYTDPELKEILKTKWNLNADTIYIRGLSFSEDLINWSDPNFELAVLLEMELATKTGDDIVMEATDIEDPRMTIESLFQKDGELTTFSKALEMFNWTPTDKGILDENNKLVKMYGVSANVPILAFSETSDKGLLAVDNYLIIQDRNNLSTYNMDTQTNILPLEGDLFEKYMTLVKSMFKAISEMSNNEE